MVDGLVRNGGWRTGIRKSFKSWDVFIVLQADSGPPDPVESLGIELGLWDGEYRGMNLPWVRVWDPVTGRMMPTAEERAEAAESLIDETRTLLQEEAERAARLAETLRALGVDPDVA